MYLRGMAVVLVATSAACRLALAQDVGSAPAGDGVRPAADKQAVQLRSGLVIESAGTAFSWQQLCVADDGRAVLAVSSKHGPLDAWLCTVSSEAGLPGQAQVKPLPAACCLLLIDGAA